MSIRSGVEGARGHLQGQAGRGGRVSRVGKEEEQCSVLRQGEERNGGFLNRCYPHGPGLGVSL